MGAQSAAITLGAEGLVWVESKDGPAWFAQPPRLKAISTVGCGDTTLAGFAYAAMRGLTGEEALRFATACGAANCLAEFEGRWKKIEASGWPVPKQVDYRLIGSALARVRWELEVNPRWKRDPNFYIEQTLTPLVEALTVPAPYDEARSREILARIENIPALLQQGEANLEKPPAPFATVAIQALDDVRERLLKMASALRSSTTLKEQELNAAADHAADALEHFRARLQEQLPSLPKETGGH